MRITPPIPPSLSRAPSRVPGGAYYSFKCLGGQGGFSVESYSVFVTEPTQSDPVVRFGGDLYLVYRPGRHSQLAIDNELQFIQVIRTNSAGPGSTLVSSSDTSGRDNPFYGEGAGLTSVNGSQSVSFYDRPLRSMGGQTITSRAPYLVMAEAFLAQDTGAKDVAGKDIVNIYGGVKWGWQVQSTS
jgi:hypothetical protein